MESLVQIIIAAVTAFAFLIVIIGKIFRNRLNMNEIAITELKTVLLTEYVTKSDVNVLTDRIMTQLDRIENKLDHKKDK